MVLAAEAPAMVGIEMLTTVWATTRADGHRETEIDEPEYEKEENGHHENHKELHHEIQTRPNQLQLQLQLRLNHEVSLESFLFAPVSSNGMSEIRHNWGSCNLVTHCGLVGAEILSPSCGVKGALVFWTVGVVGATILSPSCGVKRAGSGSTAVAMVAVATVASAWLLSSVLRASFQLLKSDHSSYSLELSTLRRRASSRVACERFRKLEDALYLSCAKGISPFGLSTLRRRASPHCWDLSLAVAVIVTASFVGSADVLPDASPEALLALRNPSRSAQPGSSSADV
jgi:hypothetical protein